MIVVRAVGFPELERALRQRAGQLAEGIRRAVEAATEYVWSDARDTRNWSTFEGAGPRYHGRKIGKRLSVAAKASLYKPNPPPGPLRKLSGRLANSITKRVIGFAGGWRGVVGTAVDYARVHELGGTIQQPPRSYLGHAAGDALRSGRKARRPMSRRTFGARTIHIPARPYLGPALERRRDAVLERLAQPVRFDDGN